LVEERVIFAQLSSCQQAQLLFDEVIGGILKSCKSFHPQARVFSEPTRLHIAKSQLEPQVPTLLKPPNSTSSKAKFLLMFLVFDKEEDDGEKVLMFRRRKRKFLTIEREKTSISFKTLKLSESFLAKSRHRVERRVSFLFHSSSPVSLSLFESQESKTPNRKSNF
jgi:hypothetical protein